MSFEHYTLLLQKKGYLYTHALCILLMSTSDYIKCIKAILSKFLKTCIILMSTII